MAGLGQFSCSEAQGSDAGHLLDCMLQLGEGGGLHGARHKNPHATCPV